MYLYLGNDVLVQTKQLIGIFDIDRTTISRDTREFLADRQKKNRVIDVHDELPKSFILCQEKEGSTLYISQISPQTLYKRSWQKRES